MIAIFNKDNLVHCTLGDDEYAGVLQIDNIPEGQYIVKIDTSDGTPKPIFADIPKNQLEQRIDSLELGMAEILGGA